MEYLTVTSADALGGTLCPPGDKSVSHRALIFAALATNRVAIDHAGTGEDVARTRQILQQLGVPIRVEESGRLVVDGQGLNGLSEPADILYTGNSGTTTRLLSGLLSAQPFFSVLSGDPSLNSRPMKRVIEPLRAMGARISGRDNHSRAPLAICGRRLRGRDHLLPVASAQVKSALLLAGLYADGVTSVAEPALSRDHTERMLASLGVPVERSLHRVGVQPAQPWACPDVSVPGDISSAAFFMVAALIVPGSEIMLRNVGVNPTRTGVIDVLRLMGAQIVLEHEREECGEPVADIVVRASRLRGVTIAGDLIPRSIDELPIIAVAAALAEGKTTIRDAAELRVKESDRIMAMVDALGRCGVEVRAREDGMDIVGREELSSATCLSYGDHRVAMSMAVAGLACGGTLRVADTGCIATSYPAFHRDLAALGVTCA